MRSERVADLRKNTMSLADWPWSALTRHTWKRSQRTMRGYKELRKPASSANGNLTSTSVAEAKLFQAHMGERGPEIRELACISQPSTPTQ
jgi:hypothetical protein